MCLQVNPMLYPTLSYASPQEAGFNPNKLALVDEQINSDVQQGFPGAGIIIVKDSKIIKQSVYGYKRKYDDNGKLLSGFDPMDVDTIFDLASNSKMYATNYAFMHLVFQHKIDLHQPIHAYIPQYTGYAAGGQCRSDRKVIDLLNHQAGYAPDPQFYNPSVISPDLYSQNRDNTEYLINTTLSFESPLGAAPVYSDVDFILLGMIIERVTQQSLDQYVADIFYKPLGLKHTGYNLLQRGFIKDDFAATEINGNTRGFTVSFPQVRTGVIQGEVHDEKAFYSMGGVAGHAGLFSNLSDMAVLSQIMLNKGEYAGLRFWDEEVASQFTAPNPLDNSYGLGWRRAGKLQARTLAWFSPYASESAVGHTGWIGTVTVIDPKYNLAIILLTNKKHSPCIDGIFEGDSYATGQYTKIISLVYEALLVL